MKYYLIAGEASGDLHGANLMKAIKKHDTAAEFRYFGGDRMVEEGGTLVKHNRELAFMGFTEVLLNIRTILKNLTACKQDVLNFSPTILILIDYPGFNLKIASFAKKQGIPVCYYISPKVWAWNQKRVLNIKKTVDKMFCILPFEVDFYKKWGMEVEYVGNPILDEIAAFSKKKVDADVLTSDRKIIALLPGSRKQEIELLLPEMIKVVDDFPEYQFVVAGAPTFNERYYQQFIQGKPVELLFGNTYNLLSVAHTAIVASGTATLETALFNVPQVVVYKGGAISIAIARMVIKVRFISLVNLIADKEIVKELIQQDCNRENLVTELLAINDGQGRLNMLQNYDKLSEIMGTPGASERAAHKMVEFASSVTSVK